MICTDCNSRRILELTAKCSDCCGYSIGNISGDGYVPSGLGIGGGDYVELNLCLDCGQVQGKFPRPISDIEKDISDAEVEEFFENNFTAGSPINFHDRRARDVVSYAEEYCNKFGAWLKEFIDINNPRQYTTGKPMPTAKQFVEMYRNNNPYLDDE